jgi:hypothetical protein
MTAAQQHAAGKPGSRGPGTRATTRTAGRARGDRPKAPPVDPARPAQRARTPGNGHDVMNVEASQNGTAGQNI